MGRGSKPLACLVNRGCGLASGAGLVPKSPGGQAHTLDMQETPDVQENQAAEELPLTRGQCEARKGRKSPLTTMSGMVTEHFTNKNTCSRHED